MATSYIETGCAFTFGKGKTFEAGGEAMQFLTEELLSAAKAMTYHVCVWSARNDKTDR